jgi:uncharacterized protein involved in exopolysaccharide biosynthesis
MEQNARLNRPTGQDNEISLLDLMATLLRHKRTIIRGTIGVALIVIFVAIGSLLLPAAKSYLPNVYTPKADILISEDTSSGLSSMLASSGLGGLASLAGISGGSGPSGDLAVFLATADSSLDELNSAFDFTHRYKIKKNIIMSTRKAVKKHLKVELDDKTNIITLSFTDIDPNFAHNVVNKLVEILDRRFEALGGNKAESQKVLLEQKLADVQAQIDMIEAKIKTFQAKYGVLSVEALATEQITVLAQMRSQLILKDLEIENYEKFSKIDDPVIRRLKSERDSIQAKITELEQGNSVLPSQREIPKISFEYAGLERDLMVQTEVFKTLTEQYELAKLNATGTGDTFQVIDLAEVPDQKSGPSRVLICVVATMVGFVLSIFLALILEAIKNIRNDPKAMAKLRGEH